jgi:hypothetical protein
MPAEKKTAAEEDEPINLQWAIQSIRKNAEKAKVGVRA